MDNANTTPEILDLAVARARLEQSVAKKVEDLMYLAKSFRCTRIEHMRRSTDPEQDEKTVKEELLRLSEAVETLIAEINKEGAVVKDPEGGLIDFYGWHKDEIVFLCWKHGESTIQHWHPIESGFAGRQRIDDNSIS